MKDTRVFKEVEISELKPREINKGIFTGIELEESNDNRGEYQELINGYVYDENGIKVEVDGETYNLWQCCDVDIYYVLG